MINRNNRVDRLLGQAANINMQIYFFCVFEL